MGRRRRLLIAILAAAGAVRPTVGQPLSSDLPEDIRVVLQSTRDYEFAYGQPGFYALLEAIRSGGRSPGAAREPIAVDDWRELMSRPGDFRGVPIVIRGVVERNVEWRHADESRRHLGSVWELQLSREGQPLICKALLASEAGDLPIGAEVEITGWFLMIQKYLDAFKHERYAAVIVGVGPTTIARRGAAARGAWPTSQTVLIAAGAVVVGLLIAWLLLRAGVSHRTRDLRSLRARGAAPASLADELSDWAATAERERASDSSRQDSPR